MWRELDELDGRTWVLEPEQPTRAMCSRRIAVDRHCSLQLELRPSAPRAQCSCRVLGSDSQAGPLRQALNSNMRTWWVLLLCVAI